MATPGRLAAPAGYFLAVLLVAACSNWPGTASHSPTVTSSSPTPNSPQTPPVATASPSSAPVALTGTYGVLVNSPVAGGPYTVSLVDVNGKVVATAQSSQPVSVSCANAAAAPVPLPVSTSNTRLYFMDAAGTIRYLAPNGDTGHATTVPAGTTTRRSMFAVSPDDRRIAVIVDDYTTSGASTRLYLEDLNGGGNHADIFSESGAYTLWPTGWHGANNLVVAKVPSCTQGGGPLCCGPTEFHVVDPATANRRFTLGGGSCGTVAGPPSPGGVLCETDAISYNAVDWTGNATQINQWISGLSSKRSAYLSPNGAHIAVSQDGTTTTVWVGNSSGSGPFQLLACGWIDDGHVLAGGDAQHQPRVADTKTGQVVAVSAEGVCGGRLPGGL